MLGERPGCHAGLLPPETRATSSLPPFRRETKSHLIRRHLAPSLLIDSARHATLSVLILLSAHTTVSDGVT